MHLTETCRKFTAFSASENTDSLLKEDQLLCLINGIEKTSLVLTKKMWSLLFYKIFSGFIF